MTTSTNDLGSFAPVSTRDHNKLARAGVSPSAAPKVDATHAATEARSQAENRTSQQAPVPAPGKVEETAQAQRTQLAEVLERVSKLDQRLSFEVDEDSGRSVVVVRDARTSEVLKQFPSEEMLTVARRLEEHLQLSGDVAGVLHADEA